MNTQNLVQGTANLYWAPLGSDEPLDPSIAPEGPWLSLGLTKGGVRMGSAQKFITLRRDKSLDISERKIFDREIRVHTGLAEHTLQNLSVVQNGGEIQDINGTRIFTPPRTTTPYMLLIDGLAPLGMSRRIIMRNVVQAGTGQFAYSFNMESVFKVAFALQEGRGEGHSSLDPYIVIDEVG